MRSFSQSCAIFTPWTLKQPASPILDDLKVMSNAKLRGGTDDGITS